MTELSEMRLVAWAGVLTLLDGAALGLWHPDASFAREPDFVSAGFTVMAIVACGVAAARSIEWWRRARRRTAIATGFVSGRSERQSLSKSTVMWQRVLEIQYDASGERFLLEWAPSGFYTNLELLLDRIDRKYPDGKEIFVRYDPHDPENAGVRRAWSAPLVTVSFVAYFWLNAVYGGFVVGSFLGTCWVERAAAEHIYGIGSWGCVSPSTQSSGR